MIDELDKRVIHLIQGDLPVEKRPFTTLAQGIGLSEQEMIRRINRLRQMGILRRFGATLRHQEAGFNANVMVAWLIPEDRVEHTGNQLARFREVTHCYQRAPQEDWPYNLYTMVHGSNRRQCRQTVQRMAEAVGIETYVMLFSEKEFKKTSMQYF